MRSGGFWPCWPRARARASASGFLFGHGIVCKRRSDGSERGPLGEWNPSEAELLRGLFLDEADKHLRTITEAERALARAAEATLEVDPQIVDACFAICTPLKVRRARGHDAIARATNG